MGNSLRFRHDLFAINVLTLVLILVIAFFPSNPLRVIIGLPFILLFPGYILTLILFPKKGDLENIERLALSFGGSIAVVPLTVLVLNYTPWGIRLYPILVSLAIFILVTSFIAYYRRHRLVTESRFTISFSANFSLWLKKSHLDKALSFTLVASLLVASGILGYVVATPKAQERFTEFYILGSGGMMQSYPEELHLGEEGKVTLGIVNREHREVDYRAELIMGGRKNVEIDSIALAHNGKWEQEVVFSFSEVAGNQKVEFLLFKDDDSNVYRTLHLWVNVTE